MLKCWKSPHKRGMGWIHIYVCAKSRFVCRAWMINSSNISLWDVITYPCRIYAVFWLVMSYMWLSVQLTSDVCCSCEARACFEIKTVFPGIHISIIKIRRSWDSLICINGYGSGHEGAAVLLPGFAIKWLQNQVTRQPHLHDLTQIYW